MPQRSPNPTLDPPASRDDRRVAPRLKADAVTWLKAVKPTVGGPGRLVDISKTGILLETNVRMLPGRRTTLLLVNHEDKRERVEAVVVRTALVSIDSEGGPLYRTALTFPKELELPVPEVEEAAPSPAASVPHPPPAVEDVSAAVQAEPHIDGPYDGLWTTDSGSQIVAVATVTEGGCVVQTSEAVAVGERASLNVFFSPVRQLRLDGKVTSLTPDQQGCVVRFTGLTQEQRRVLRVEIRGRVPGADRKTSSASPTLFAARSRTEQVAKSFSVSLQANEW